MLLGVNSGPPPIVLRLQDMLMFDWDDIDEATCRGRLNELMSKIDREVLFRIYRTTNGYYGFLVSETCPPRRVRSIEWARFVKSDTKYVWMSVARGHYGIRISPKHENDKISEFVDQLGNAKAHERLSKVMLAHDLIINWAQDVQTPDWQKQDVDWLEVLQRVCQGIDEAKKASD